MSWKDAFPKENRYYETENGILYCGDCLKIMRKFPEGSIDSIITSPPYNVGIDYSDWNDNLEFEEYLNFLRNFLILSKNALTPDGRIGINHLFDSSIPFRHSPLMELYKLFREVGLKYNTIIELREKVPHRVKNTAWGSWLSASAPYVCNTQEGILVGYREVWKKKNRGKTTISPKEFMKLTTGIWDYVPIRQITKANFSESIPANWMKIFTYESDIVLDSFMGAGTTAIVAEKLKRRWIGIEISKDYCEIAKQRIEEIVRQPCFLEGL